MKTKPMTQRKLAIFMHNTYEKMAKTYGWNTQKITQVKFDNLPRSNKITMLHLAKAIIYFFETHNQTSTSQNGKRTQSRDAGRSVR